MGKLVASIDVDCYGRLFELRLGTKVIETLRVCHESYSDKKFQVARTTRCFSQISDVDTLYFIDDDRKNPRRVVSDEKLNIIEIMKLEHEEETLFTGTELQCARFARKWLENEYSIK